MVIYKTVEDEMIDVATICAAPRASPLRARWGGGQAAAHPIAANVRAREVDNPARPLRS